MRPTPIFRDRRDAGRMLGATLRAYAGHGDLVVLGLPRGGVPVADEVAKSLGVPLDIFTVGIFDEREQLLRGDRPAVDVAGSVVIVVDDGMATGATMREAVVNLRARHAREIITAVPVASAEACAALSTVADRCVCLAKPVPFVAIGLWYWAFPQVEDADVRDILLRANAGLPEASTTAIY
jgi:predicted phosphoribosyltransferase